MRTILMIATLGGLLAAALAVALWLWWAMGDVDIGVHGLIALFLGVVVSLALGGGLMALVFYSSRHGHDDAPFDPTEDDRDR